MSKTEKTRQLVRNTLSSKAFFVLFLLTIAINVFCFYISVDFFTNSKIITEKLGSPIIYIFLVCITGIIKLTSGVALCYGLGFLYFSCSNQNENISDKIKKGFSLLQKTIVLYYILILPSYFLNLFRIYVIVNIPSLKDDADMH
ncbi:MAG: hypothetical protein A2Y15_03575 [Clostridiales bacterium GWF2_36_10]|nr:MAG: hypothetical protein A2Y15_03575 [Clostridiales bacterium GWF2_36_10]HAN20295.1 hypothetical protein [Clostridiales bacterium]